MSEARSRRYDASRQSKQAAEVTAEIEAAAARAEAAAAAAEEGEEAPDAPGGPNQLALAIKADVQVLWHFAALSPFFLSVYHRNAPMRCFQIQWRVSSMPTSRFAIAVLLSALHVQF